MMMLQVGLMILALVVLYHLMVWIVPILAGVGLGWLAIHSGSGWLVGIGVGILGAGLALALLQGAMASRSNIVRFAALALYAVPPIWAGAIATRAMAIQNGAQGPVWPIIAGIGGAILFGALAIARLAQMVPPIATAPPAPSSEPVHLRTMPLEPEPKVIYYQPAPPPRLEDRRGDAPVIDM
jgi:hypothetical protein